jgi:hypothetical protein
MPHEHNEETQSSFGLEVKSQEVKTMMNAINH